MKKTIGILLLAAGLLMVGVLANDRGHPSNQNTEITQEPVLHKAEVLELIYNFDSFQFSPVVAFQTYEPNCSLSAKQNQEVSMGSTLVILNQSHKQVAENISQKSPPVKSV